MEAEGSGLLVHGSGIHNVTGPAVDLQAVQVHDHAEVVQMIVGGEQHGLPHLALGDLAVTQQRIDIDVLAQVLGALGHTRSGGDALAQRAGGHIHAGNGIHIGMALEIAVDMPQGGQVLHGEEAPVSKRGIQARSGMALGQHEAVPVRPTGVLGVYPQLLIIKICKHLRGGQASAGVTGLGPMGRFNDPHADLAGFFLQIKFQFFCQETHLPSLNSFSAPGGVPIAFQSKYTTKKALLLQ